MVDLGCLVAELQPYAKALVDLAGRAGVQPRVTSTCRSHAQQQRLYDAFLRGETKYPVAPPGRSAHEFGYAFDMVADTRENLHDLGSVWSQWGGVWSPSDEVHFELPGFVPGEATEQPGGIPCGGLAGLFGWKCTTLYQAEDVIVGVLTPFKATIAELLLEAGYPNSEVAEILRHPVSELHRKFPWIPF